MQHPPNRDRSGISSRVREADSKSNEQARPLLIGRFLNGLQEDLKADVRIHKPCTVYKAMSLAKEFESKLGPHHMNKGPYSSTYPHRVPLPREGHNAGTNLLTTTRTPPSSSQLATYPNSTRPWDAERQNRLANGLCFRCNEKFGPSHKCKIGSFSLLELT